MTNILVNFNAIKIRRIPKTLWAYNLQSTLRFLSTKSVRLSTVQGNMDCIKYFSNAQDCYSKMAQGAFTYGVRFLGRQVGQAASDFTTQAYVVKYLIRVGRQVKNAPKISDVICECSRRIVIATGIFLKQLTIYIHKFIQYIRCVYKTLNTY